jgi:hypothetical protein
MKHVTPIKAIRAKCLDCTCHQPKEIRECPIITCPLWLYRMGRRPKADELIEVERKGAVNNAAAHVG